MHSLICDENNEKSTSSQNSNTQISTVDLVETQQPKTIEPMKQRGRVPLWQQFSTLIEVVEDFIKRHSFSAQCRRRQSTGTGTGVSSKQIREHVMNEVPVCGRKVLAEMQYISYLRLLGRTP